MPTKPYRTNHCRACNRTAQENLINVSVYAKCGWGQFRASWAQGKSFFALVGRFTRKGYATTLTSGGSKWCLREWCPLKKPSSGLKKTLKGLFEGHHSLRHHLVPPELLKEFQVRLLESGLSMVRTRRDLSSCNASMEEAPMLLKASYPFERPFFRDAYPCLRPFQGDSYPFLRPFKGMPILF